MTSHLALFWHRLRRRLWFRPALWSLLAVGACMLSASADRWLPVDKLPDLADGVVDDLLHIMASSMLAVSTFSLSVLVNAFASAATAGTPRAARLVVADPHAQRAVATFLAAFIFSVVGIIALGTRLYGSSARFVLFLFALAMLVWIVYAFMEWIETLSKIGRVSHTIATVETATQEAMRTRVHDPLLGATETDTTAPTGSHPVLARETAYVQAVDVARLQVLAERVQGRLHVAAASGDFVTPVTPLVWLHPGAQPDDDFDTDVCNAFVFGPERTIEQDASYGLIVLAEIAQRALSPAVNDPGTAIAVLGSQTRLLIDALQRAPMTDDERQRHDRVYALPANPSALVGVSYDPIARAGGNMLEVQQQLQRHLGLLSRACGGDIAEASIRQARRCLERAERAGLDDTDMAQLRDDHREAFPPV